jgi:uncharacterized protein
VATHPFLLDSGLLIALLDQHDKHHGNAISWVKQFKGRLVSVEHVLTEAAFFVGNAQRVGLAQLVADGWIELHMPDKAAYRRIAEILHKYAYNEPDLADACLVWLAETTGIHQILTVDVRDFSTYRINGRTKFEIIPWQSAS